MDLHDSISFTFNKFFYDLVKGVMDLSGGEVRKTLKQHYKVRATNTHQNIELFNNALNDSVYQKLVSLNPEGLLVDDEFKAMEIVQGVKVSAILDNTPADYHTTFASFVYIFTLLGVVYKEKDESAGRELFNAIMGALRNMQRGEEYESCLADVYDDDIKVLVGHTSKVIKNTANDLEEKDVPELTPEFLEGTKIGSLAKEITKEINLEDLNIDKPEDLLNMSNTNVIGNIMGKVGTKINEKLEKGEIKHEDLLKEAFSLLGAMQKGGAGPASALFNNPLMQNMMKNAANVRIDESKLRNLSTRDRLKKKHEEKYGK